MHPNNFQSAVFSILDHQLTPGPLLIGFSGGLDSRVLLEIASRYVAQREGFSLQAVHVHHGLNPKADQWLDFCAQVCAQAGILFTAEHVAIERSSRQSLEDIARQARYEVFRKNLYPQGTLLTAHHQDDQLETLLLALKRGSGPRGLSAMPVHTIFASGYLFRPLLNFSRQQLEEWAVQQHLSWIEDDSNLDERFDRNFLRHSVIPLLKQRWPEIGATAGRTAELCAEQELLLSEIAQQDLAVCQHPDGSLLIAKLAEYSQARLHQLLRFWLRQQTGFTPSQAQLQKIWPEVAMAREDATPELVWLHGVLRRYQQRLYQVKPGADLSALPTELSLRLDHPITLPGGVLTLRSVCAKEAELRLPDADEQYSVRFNVPGSMKAHPVGRQHSRELKKLWQEYGVAPWLRSSIPVICCQGKIVAAVGIFISKEYACSASAAGIRIDWVSTA